MTNAEAEQLRRAAEQLKRVVELQHGGKATHTQTVRVVAASTKPGVWPGIVHIYDLKDHPTAKRAYAWSSKIQGGRQGSDNRFFAVLHQGKVIGPVQAVKAAAGEIQRAGRASR